MVFQSSKTAQWIGFTEPNSIHHTKCVPSALGVFQHTQMLDKNNTKIEFPVRVRMLHFCFTYNEQIPSLFHFPMIVCVRQIQTIELCTSEISASVHTLNETKWCPRDAFLRQNTSPQEKKKKTWSGIICFPSYLRLFLTFLPAGAISFVTKITCL